MSWKAHFSAALGRPGAPLHFAAHSHHPWPDVTRAAHLAAWEDAQRLLDDKWDMVFAEIVPRARGDVANVLNLPKPDTVVFAPNTHDFVRRILSCLPVDRPPRILSTCSEFHSFARQIDRLEEEGLVAAHRIAAEPFDTFLERFRAAAAADAPDLVFVSQVFFDTGFAPEPPADLVGAVADTDALVVVDGYHGFCARPTDFGALADRAFYLAGGYKYAMAGEGCCFLHCPPRYAPRPRDTGWYAAFGALADARDGVAYASDGGRFWGATFDPSGLYRFSAAQAWMAAEGLTVARADAHCRALQIALVERLERAGGALAGARLVFDPRTKPGARFLAFETPRAGGVDAALRARGVMVDHRAERLRIGFGVYHDLEDVERLHAHLLAAA